MKESDIRPQDLFNEYLSLSAKDIPTYFSELFNNKSIAFNCVACDSDNHKLAFIKEGFKYSTCEECDTLFVFERPNKESYSAFYSGSPSSNYWAQVFYPAIAESRREKLFNPRAEKVLNITKDYNVYPCKRVCDVGGGYGIFAQEWQKISSDSSVAIIEPGEKLAQECRKKNFDVIQTDLEGAPDCFRKKFDLITCFEVIEHAYDPFEFVSSLYNLVKPGGIAVVTGLGVEGFDIQILWEKSKSISPPHHINFMSVNGFIKLFKRVGFDKVDVITPGVLDVDIVKTQLQSDTDSAQKLSRFEKLMFTRGEKFLEDFQELLGKHQLSSHCWIIAQR